MNASNLYTRSRLGLDNRVWLALLITVLFSIGLLAFKMGTHESCMAISLSVTDNEHPDGSNFFPKDRLTFEANMRGMKEVTWDFGDNSPLVNGSTVTHAFAHAGNFFITATVNGKCKELLSVYIHPEVVQRTAVVTTETLEDIIGSETPKAGEPTVYSTGLSGATYEWNVLNAPEYPTQKTPTITYTFQTPGAKILELRVGSKVIRKNINVLPSDKPLVDPNAVAQMQQQQMPQQQQPMEEVVEPVKAAPRSTYIADEVFRDMLDKVTDGEKDASSFSQFLCNGPQTKVRENGESWTTLGELCSKIHDKKKYKIRSVVTIRDPNDKCVLQLQVTYKKRGFLGL